MSERLFVNLAPMCNSGHIDGSGFIVNLVNDTVIANANAPFLIAALEFFAAWRPGNRCETFEARHDAGNHLRGQPMQFFFRACG